MKRGSKILIGLGATALTYMSLMLLAGPRHMGYGGFRAYGGERQMHCERFHRGDADKHTSVTPKQEESFPANPGNNNK